MIRAYLLLNAALYLIFSLWCTFSPEKTAANIGFAFRSGSGRSEFVTVYGGLELGMAVFFLITGMRGEYQLAGLLFALCLYAAIVAFRIVTLLTVPGIERITYGTFGLEAILGIAAAILWWKRGV